MRGEICSALYRASPAEDASADVLLSSILIEPAKIDIAALRNCSYTLTSTVLDYTDYVDSPDLVGEFLATMSSVVGIKA